MAVEHVGEIYKCKVCGNKVEVIEAGGGNLACCNKNMQIVVEKSEITVNLPDSGG